MRKRILFLLPRCPYPPIGGEKNKNFQLLKLLSNKYDVHLVCLTEENIGSDDLNELKKYAQEVKIFYKNKWLGRFRTILSIFNGLPLQINYYYHSDVQEYVVQAALNVDIVYCGLIRTAIYGRKINKPKILDLADSVALNYKNSANKTTSLFWKLIYLFESNRLLKFEKDMISAFDKAFFFNQEEEKLFDMPQKTQWVPHGVNEFLLNYKKTDQQFSNVISFIGKMDYRPNIEAAKWFCTNVMPLLPEELKFYIVGASPTEEVKGLAKSDPRIVVTGYVEDPFLILKSSLCVVAPMQTGAGIQNKVLEAMALGQVVVSTSLGARALVGIKNNQEIIIADYPEEYAEIIKKIFKKEIGRELISKQAKLFIENNFTWDAYSRVLYHTLEGLNA